MSATEGFFGFQVSEDFDALLFNADCLGTMSEMPDACVDAIVTDPPAGIGFMGKTWDKPGVLGVSGGRAMPATTSSRNPSCKVCGGRKRAGPKTKGCVCERPTWNDVEYRLKDRLVFVSWMTSVFTEALRVLKPGGHALVWAIPRTSHWTATALEDAGFEVRDRISHVFGTGFPKSLSVGKAISKVTGEDGQLHKEWQGFGTALKPAMEDWWVCRRPLDGTVAQNVIKHGVGAFNVDGCRVGTPPTPDAVGRYPANLIHDGSDEVLELFPDSNGQQGAVTGKEPSSEINNVYGDFNGRPATTPRGDKGSAARFFYCAKASAKDRGEGNKHATVKPTDLMRYLCRLVTPPGGIVLDPFMGSGSTGKAARLEGFRFIGVEKELDSYHTALKRVSEIDEQEK